MAIDNISEISAEVAELARICSDNGKIAPELYGKYNVKRGLRDLNGKGVLTGLTEISEVRAKEIDENGNEIPCEGKLFYRGINLEEHVRGFVSEGRFCFEETVYLLLFGNLPSVEELSRFTKLLANYRTLRPALCAILS